ncbi:hypothetical protein AMECASPLE_035951 [Ameca splendens]|uniref:Uncharacterized protein n=1 Tax=Ameca splendens TaxID=208324 RepID=A0ABV0ZGZ8_9TELE
MNPQSDNSQHSSTPPNTNAPAGLPGRAGQPLQAKHIPPASPVQAEEAKPGTEIQGNPNDPERAEKPAPAPDNPQDSKPNPCPDPDQRARSLSWPPTLTVLMRVVISLEKMEIRNMPQSSDWCISYVRCGAVLVATTSLTLLFENEKYLNF